jgi:hypothetical protein
VYISGLSRGCLRWFRGYEGVYRVHFVSETVQFELETGTSVGPCLKAHLPGDLKRVQPRRLAVAAQVEFRSKV